MTNVEIVNNKNVNSVNNVNTKNIEINGQMISLSKVFMYGSQTGNLKDSKYSQTHQGKIALLGNSKFTQSKNPESGTAKIVLDDGTTWYVGISKTGLGEGF